MDLPKTPRTDRKSVLRRIQEKKREMKEADDNLKELSAKQSKAFRTAFKSNVKDLRRTNLQMQVDRDLIHRNIYSQQQNIFNIGGDMQILPDASEMNNTLLTSLVLDLDYNKSETKSVHFDMKRQLPAEEFDDVYDYNSDRSGDISKVFLRRALRKSKGGAMLALNDGYHLRSYLDSSTGQIQLTPRTQTGVNGDGGNVPLLPAEQGTASGSGPASTSREKADTLASPERQSTGKSTREAVLSPKGDVGALVSNPDAQPTHALSDCVFLVGPDKEQVDAAVVKYLSTSGMEVGGGKDVASSGVGGRERTISAGRVRTASSSSAASMSSTATLPTPPTQPQTKSLEPCLLYHTQLHPDLEAELVPFFCFPGGVSVTMRPPSAPPPGSSTPNTPKAGMGLHSPSVSIRRKSLVGITQGPGVLASRPSSNVRCFSFLLSSHFSTQYGVCFVFQRTYHYRDKAGRFGGVSLSVSVDYCVCVVTKVPFLSFFFHTLTNFEAQGGLDHQGSGYNASAVSHLSPSGVGVGISGVPMSPPSTPNAGMSQPGYILPALEEMFHSQEEGMPLHSDLWLLNDLAGCLASTLVPLYPRLVDEYDSFFITGEVRDAEERSPSGERGTRVRTQSSGSVNSMNSTGGGVKASNRATVFEALCFTVMVKQQRRLDLCLDREAVWRSFAAHMEPLVALAVDGALTQGQGYNDSVSSPARKDKDQDSGKRSGRGPLARAAHYFSSVACDRDLEGGQHVLCWALPILLRHVPLDQLLMALGCALNEMKIVVLSEDTTVLSGCVLALWRLLRPLKWAGNVIVTLPDFLSELLESPSFFLIGMKSLPPDFALSQGLIVIDARERSVNLHPADVVVSHTLQVPLHARLLTSLKPHAEGIIQAYRSSRREARLREREQRLVDHGQLGLGLTPPGAGISPDPRSPLLSPKAFDKATAVSPDPRSPTLPQYVGHGRPSVHAAMNSYGASAARQPGNTSVPLPCDLDHTSSTGKALSAAVAGFYSVMSRHLQTLLNTAVRQEEERSKRDQRQKERQAGEAEGSGGTQERGKKGIRAGINRALQSIRPKEEDKHKEKEKEKDRDRDTQVSSGEKEGGEGEGKYIEVAGFLSPAPSEAGSFAGVGADPLASYDSAVSKQTDTATRLRMRTASEGYSSGGGSSVDSEHQGSNESKDKGDDSVEQSRAPFSSPSRRRKEARDLVREKEKAQIFSSKDIGESGVVFLKQLLRTQAFSNYLFDRTQRGAARKVTEIRQQYKAQLAAHKERVEKEAAEREAKGVEDEAGGKGSILDQMTVGNPLRAGVGTRESTLKSLFTIAITGALPVEESRLKELQTSLDGLEERIRIDYQKQVDSLAEQIRRMSSSEEPTGDALSMPMVTLPSSRRDRSDSLETSEERGILWCNGRCGGMADTPNCTVMCVVLWSKRLQRAKSSVGVHSLIRKYHAGSGSGAHPQSLGHFHPREKVLGGISLPGVNNLSMLVRSMPARHPRETDAQFQLRLREARVATNSSRVPTMNALGSSYTTNSDLIYRAYGRAGLPIDPLNRERVLVQHLMRRQSLLQSYELECRRVGLSLEQALRVQSVSEGESKQGDRGKDKGASRVGNKVHKRAPIYALEAFVAYHTDHYRTIQRKRQALALRILAPFMHHVLNVVRRTLLLKTFARLQIRRWLRGLDGYLDGSGFRDVRLKLRSARIEFLSLTENDNVRGAVSFLLGTSQDAVYNQSSSSSSSNSDTDLEEGENEEEKEQAREREKERRRSRVQTIRDQMGAYFTPTHSSSSAAAAAAAAKLEVGSERQGPRGSPSESDSDRRSLSRQSSFPSMPGSTGHSYDPDSSPTSFVAQTEELSMAGSRDKNISSGGRGVDDSLKDREIARDGKSSPVDPGSSRWLHNKAHESAANANHDGQREQGDDEASSVKGRTKSIRNGKTKAKGRTHEGLALRIDIESGSSGPSPDSAVDPSLRLPSPTRSPSGTGMLSVSLGFSPDDVSPNPADLRGKSPVPSVNTTNISKTKRGDSSDRQSMKEREVDQDDKFTGWDKERAVGRGSTKSVKSIPSMSSVTTATTGRGSDPRGMATSRKTVETVSKDAKANNVPSEVTPTPSPRSSRGRNWSDDLPVDPNSEPLTPEALRKLSSSGINSEDALMYEDSPVAKAPRSGSISMSGRLRGRLDSVDSVSGSVRALTYPRLDETSRHLLSALGPAASDKLTSQQLSMVVGMYNLLREGVEVRKHSSKGSPQKRLLYCDANLSVLYWRLPSSKASHLSEHEEEELVQRAVAKSKTTGATVSTFRASFESGGSRISTSGGDSERSSTTTSSGWSLFRSSDKDRILVLRDVSEVSAEVANSPILKKAVDRGQVQRAGKRRENGQPQYTDQAGNKVGLVSMTGRSRNLVFDMAQERWGELFHAMQVLVNYFRSQREQEEGLEIDLNDLI